MSKRKKLLPAGIDYKAFSDPYTGLAAMVLVQAAADLLILDGKDEKRIGGDIVRKRDVLTFLQSPWAQFLSESCGVTMRTSA